MRRVSSLQELGPQSSVHLVEISIDDRVMGGPADNDPFDRDRGREVANLIRRVCTRQAPASDHAVVAVRMGSIRVLCGFLGVGDRDWMMELSGAEAVAPGEWASRAHALLDPAKLDTLEGASAPKDTRGAGRRARQRQIRDEELHSPRWRLFPGKF